MNPKSTQLILIATLTAVVTTAACSKKAEPVTVVKPSQPVTLSVRPEAPKTVAFTASEAGPQVKRIVDQPPSGDKPKSKDVVFKSRDYGVSFQYPWQYTRVGARAIADDCSLQPQQDGLESQISLVRIDVPQGFYPGTDFESGYFILSLNPELKEEQCKTTLGKDGKPQTLKIDDTDFLWTENESGGHGESSKVRNYVAYVNDTCYEIETGVKTRNDGMAREVNPEQVLRRLDPILMSVKIDAGKQSPQKQTLQSQANGAAQEQGK